MTNTIPSHSLIDPNKVSGNNFTSDSIQTKIPIKNPSPKKPSKNRYNKNRQKSQSIPVYDSHDFFFHINSNVNLLGSNKKKSLLSMMSLCLQSFIQRRIIIGYQAYWSLFVEKSLIPFVSLKNSKLKIFVVFLCLFAVLSYLSCGLRNLVLEVSFFIVIIVIIIIIPTSITTKYILLRFIWMTSSIVSPLRINPL